MDDHDPPQNIKFKKRMRFIVVMLFLAFIFVRFSSISIPTAQVDNIEQARLVMYSTSACHYCRKARVFFAKHKIPYFEYNIDQSITAKRKFIALNGRGTPLIIIGTQRIDGFDKKLLTRLLLNDN